jgi:TolB protein
MSVGNSQCIVPTSAYSELNDRESINLDLDEQNIPYQGRLVYSYEASLYVLDFDTRELQHFDGVRLMVNPAWNPSGNQIAFGRSNIYVVDIHTSEITRLTPSEITEWDPSWSPDGQQLVYTLMAGERGLYVMNMETHEELRIPTTERVLFHPSWSPDGNQIAFVMEGAHGENQVYVLDTQCISQGRCTPTELTDANGQSYMPDWSPDGQQIVFVSNREGFWAIYVMNNDGANQRRLTYNEYGDFSPAWSPDGEYIVFERKGLGMGERNNNLYIMRPDGSEVTCITSNGGREPDWWMDLDSSD